MVASSVSHSAVSHAGQVGVAWQSSAYTLPSGLTWWCSMPMRWHQKVELRPTLSLHFLELSMYLLLSSKQGCQSSFSKAESSKGLWWNLQSFSWPRPEATGHHSHCVLLLCELISKTGRRPIWQQGISTCGVGSWAALETGYQPRVSVCGVEVFTRLPLLTLEHQAYYPVPKILFHLLKRE